MQGVCAACPYGAHCQGGSDIVPNVGYWCGASVPLAAPGRAMCYACAPAFCQVTPVRTGADRAWIWTAEEVRCARAALRERARVCVRAHV